ncbi:MAG: hypothetical protein IJ306_03870 [Oscillospiraceae bacterium]|nr:hypothetical protein [Oscillospiraceae bacterium]
MNAQIEKYISEKSLCSELIFDDWKEFLKILFEIGGKVNEILWFEYTSIEKQPESMGSGGYTDRQNPDYMWAETMIYDKNLSEKSFTELSEHIERTINKYQPHNLVPSFFDIEI